MVKFIVISYDIRDNKRRVKIAKTLKDHGTRVQYSVFECLLKKDQFTRLKEKLIRVIKPEEDTLRFYQLCQSCKDAIELAGTGKITEDEDFYVI